MATDPVCGMFVDERTAELKAEVHGVTYYFCCETCMREFVAPEKEARKLKFGVVAAIVLAVPVLFLTGPALTSRSWDYALLALDTPIQFGIGWRFYRGAYDAIRNRMGNMDVLIALGTSAAWAYSAAVTLNPGLFKTPGVYFDASATIITLVLAGRYLENVTKGRASDAVRKLMAMSPLTALRVNPDGTESEIPVESVKVGDTLVVKPGERIPVDAIVLAGTAAVDESMITGESMPVDKGVGDGVIGATINKSGLLKIKADKVGQDSTLVQIVRLVERAQAGTAPIQRLADRVASYFVPVVIAVALVAALSWYFVGSIGLDFSVLAFVSVVIIACPCALGVATPAALMVGTSVGAQSGVLIKGGESLERMAKVDTMVFDKTGTLTVGRPSVTDVVPADGFSRDDLLRIAAAAERGSEHPLGEAIVQEAKRHSLSAPEPSDFAVLPGKGVSAAVDGVRVLVGTSRLATENGVDVASLEADMIRLEEEAKSTVVVIAGGKIAGTIAVADTVRATAKPAVEALQAMGIEVIMLTGDNNRTASVIAGEAGIKRFVAQVLPDKKEEVIASLQKEGRKVAMVGDGINDAPALATADVGVAIGSGTDIAKETGGIILIKDDLMDVPLAAKLSRATLSKIKQNLFWAFAYNVILIPVAAGILVPFLCVHIFDYLPLLAAVAMAVSSTAVITNSLFLFSFRAS